MCAKCLFLAIWFTGGGLTSPKLLFSEGLTPFSRYRFYTVIDSLVLPSG